VIAGIFDVQTERLTAGRVPAQFTDRLDADLTTGYARVVGVAHNAGDEVETATRAAAWGADAIEVDVRSTGGRLFAGHDAPLSLLEDVFFRGPTLAQAWQVAQLRGTVLLHLKEHSPAYLAKVRDFVGSQPPHRLIVQSGDVPTLRFVQGELPYAERLLLIFTPGEVARLESDPSLLRVIDGVSVRDSLLSPELMSWAKRRKLLVFSWVVNGEARMNALVKAGVDGLISERLDMLQLLGQGIEVVRRRVPR
jgi:glycerophosphoryl diester phosphodiesterase